MTAVHDLTALEIGAALAAGELSPVEVVEHYLGRIERLDAAVGAFVTVTADRAIAQARAAERALRDGRASGPLHGVPMPVKDLVRVAGVRCTLGSAVFADAVAEVSDGVVRRLADAGTVLLGTTNTAEFGISCYTENAVAPPARSPWDLSRSAGGSSGGAGAAVAAGLAPLAHGTDGGGSVRIPASACGLVGLKPTRGRVSSGPLLGDVSGLPTSGVLARTVRDAAAGLDAMAGGWPGDPAPLPPLPAGETFLATADRPPRRLRVACFREPVLAEVSVHPEVVAAYDAARQVLADLGHDVEEVHRPFGPESVPAFEQVWAVLSLLVPVEPADERRLLPLTRWQRERGRGVSGAAYATALGAMQQAGRAAATAFSAYDVVLCPTLAQLPAPVGALRDDTDPARDFAGQEAFSPFCATFNITGQPALQLPLHWTAAGLPVGVQVAGRHGEEATLLALGAQIEEARPWRERHGAVEHFPP